MDTAFPCLRQGRPLRVLSRTKKEDAIGVLFFGARDGTRTHTAKPHAPQTCLSTIPTLSQALEYYNLNCIFCQYLFMNPLKDSPLFGKLLTKEEEGILWHVSLFPVKK